MARARASGGSARVERRDKGRPRGAAVTEAVLAQTLEELARAGLEGLRVERIAQAAEVNKTSVYRRWPTREALVAAALEGILRTMEASLEGARPPGHEGSLEGDLHALATQVSALLAQPVGRAVVRAALAEGASQEVAALASSRLRQQSEGPARAMVQRAQRRGEWREGLGADVLLSTLVGALLHRAMLERGALSPRWLGALIELLLYGALPRDARGAARRTATVGVTGAKGAKGAKATTKTSAKAKTKAKTTVTPGARARRGRA